LQPERLEYGQLDVAVPNHEQYRYLTQRCQRAFSEAAQSATGRLVSVRFHLADKADNDGQVPAQPACQAGPQDPILDDNYTFENFVTGPCNRLAHAACLAVSESPGKSYNPLFIHGNVGLGKTHLLQAVCHHALSCRSAERIVYVTCERFATDLLEAVQCGLVSRFRRYYRQVDLLVIDDIQLLAGRERSQEEFIHTFNALYQLDKQIILSADRAPAEIPSLQERLVSRFNWGLVARIDRPGLETRMAILRQKAGHKGLELPEEVVYLVASRIDANIRELEGAVNKLESLSRLTGRAVDMALAEEALGQRPSQPVVSIEAIIDAVMRRYNVRLAELQSRRRSRSAVLARQVCMYLARELTDRSLQEIGGYFGGRDHTTVLHATRSIARRCQSDPDLRAALDELTSSLRGLNARPRK
ncbi:MAG: chromosomal replication initiator protein DnaA, partial [Phycisphaerae bacterium]